MFRFIACFRAKWIPVRVKTARRIKRVESGSDPIRTGKALAIAAATGALLGGASIDHAAAADLSPRNSPAPICGGWKNAVCEHAVPHRTAGDVWGSLEARAFLSGTRMAPNGVTFDPLFSLSSNFNLGILPDKKLYFFTDENFWMQRPGAGITNPTRGKFDFSKREFDFVGGLAWNYYGPFELRVSTYAFSNLNRGTSLRSPYGFKDGVLVENRYYFGGADKYDTGRLSFLSVGYYPSKSLVGGDGEDFRPGFFGRAYVTYGLPSMVSWLATAYLFGDAKITTERYIKPRLFELDAGLALRPFEAHQNVEFRIGSDATFDVQDHVDRNLIYTAVRFAY
jgi:hypothetical protein